MHSYALSHVCRLNVLFAFLGVVFTLSAYIDFQKEQATIFSAYEIAYPQPTAAEIAERYDINKLSEGKR